MILLMGLLGGDDEPSDESDDLEGGDDLLGGGDDLMGGGDDLVGDDALFTDDGGGDGGAKDEDELNYQLDEIEKEVDSLTNKVDTVRGENEKISESISTVERNVDKLVELYEIVTQGINPFVGDQEIGNAFETAAQGGVFGGDDPEDDIDEDIIGADAEDFLDDEMDDDDEEFDDFDETADDGDAFDEATDDGFDEFDDDLEDDTTADDEAEFDDDLEDDTTADDEAEFDDDLEDGQVDPAGDGDDPLEALADESTAETDGVAVDGTDPAAESESAVGGPLSGENGEIGDPPYLVRVPSRTDAELLTLEWVDFLVEAAGVSGAAETFAYYESIEWISEPVATYLQSMLSGFGDGGGAEPEDDIEPRSVLSTVEHKRSLQYIAWIATPEKAPDPLLDESDDAVTSPIS
ncbi:FlaD/FlaE family flagellar protein [Natrialbaceae archaeon GCM10025810]|uniref:FlaD/FlaE family flagellar protein n=1 Tax=Halovalidus salilacus TaxID=3075124 RepID=UPI003608E657